VNGGTSNHALSGDRVLLELLTDVLTPTRQPGPKHADNRRRGQPALGGIFILHRHAE
jgi:hypothetical protein